MIYEFVLSLLLKRDDYQGNKDVDEEERKDNEVNNVEDGHFHSEARLRAVIFIRGINRVP